VKVSFFVSICFAVILAGSPVVAQAKARSNVLSGRWNVVFDMGEGYYETPIEFIVEANGDVVGTVLGQLGTFRIEEATGRLEGNKLTMSARTSYGKLKLSATLNGDSLNGKWSPTGFFSPLFFKGEVRGLRDKTYVSSKPRQVIFDSLLSQIERNFYSPDFNGVDLDALRQRYRPLAAAARCDGEFLTIVRKMLAELHSSHLEFFAEATGTGELYKANPRQARSAEAAHIRWKKLTPAVGYLLIESFDSGPQIVERVDKAFAELGDLPALVIDVRGNGGGTLSAAMRIGDYLFTETRPVGYLVDRLGLARLNARSIDGIDPATLPTFNGYDPDELGREMERTGALMVTTGGRAGKPYRGRLVVLIDEYCDSMTEAFVSVVKETRAGTLIGRHTSGAMLGATTFAVEGGWTLMIPVWDFRTPKRVRVEGVGVGPDVFVKYRQGKDVDLAAALRFLKMSEPATKRQGSLPWWSVFSPTARAEAGN